MTLLGGMGTIFGPFVGAAIIVTMQNYFASFGAWVTIMQGTIFVISVMLFREGFVGVLSRWLKRSLAAIARPAFRHLPTNWCGLGHPSCCQLVRTVGANCARTSSTALTRAILRTPGRNVR